MPIDQNLDELMVGYFAERPEEISEFLHMTFSTYAMDGNTAAFWSALSSVARAEGISNVVERVDEKSLTLDDVNAVLQAMGYRLAVEKAGETTVAESIQSSRFDELSNEIVNMMEEAGVTLADLLEDLPKIRKEIHQERLSMSTYQASDDTLADYLIKRSNEVDEFVTEISADYAEDGKTAVVEPRTEY